MVQIAQTEVDEIIVLTEREGTMATATVFLLPHEQLLVTAAAAVWSFAPLSIATLLP